MYVPIILAPPSIRARRSKPNFHYIIYIYFSLFSPIRSYASVGGLRPQIAHGPGTHKKLVDEPSSLHSTRVPISHSHHRTHLTSLYHHHARRIPYRLLLLLHRLRRLCPSHVLIAHHLSPFLNTGYLHPYTRRTWCRRIQCQLQRATVLPLRLSWIPLPKLPFQQRSSLTEGVLSLSYLS